MHLPPEVERLVPELLGRLTPAGSIDPDREAERIETLLLAGDPHRWLGYLRERGRLVAVQHRPEADPRDLSRLAGIFRDQLALIQVAVELEPADLALLEELERLE